MRELTLAGQDATSQSSNGDVEDSRDQGLLDIGTTVFVGASVSRNRVIGAKVRVVVFIASAIVRGTGSEAVVGTIAHG